MVKKDYELIAGAVARIAPLCRLHGEKEMLHELVAEMAHRIGMANPAFRSQTFLDACKLPLLED